MNGQGGGPERQAEQGDQGNEADAARRLDQTAVFIGAVVAIATLAIGAGLLYFLLNDNDSDTTPADAAASKKQATTTTTTAPGSTTTAPGGSSAAGTLPATGGAGPSTTTTTVPPTPMATADPDDPVYVGESLPPGVSVSLTSCRWEPANGGQLEASGTITSATDDAWIITAVWLQNQRELDEADSDFYDFDEVPGTTKTWQLTMTAPLPPADLTCAVEVF